MPLKSVRSNATKKTKNKVVSGNIVEMVDKWKDTGKIGNTSPKTKAKAVQIAVAASLSKVDQDKKKAKKKKS